VTGGVGLTALLCYMHPILNTRGGGGGDGGGLLTRRDISTVLYNCSSLGCLSLQFGLLSELSGDLINRPVLGLGHCKEDIHDEEHLDDHEHHEHIGSAQNSNRFEAQADQEVS